MLPRQPRDTNTFPERYRTPVSMKRTFIYHRILFTLQACSIYTVAIYFVYRGTVTLRTPWCGKITLHFLLFDQLK